MKSGKHRSVLRTESKGNVKNKRKHRWNKAWMAVLILICSGIIVGGVYYFGMDKVSYADTDEWVDWEMADMVEVDNQSNQTLTTARATFYDVYSDSQVWDGYSYRSTLGDITDGGDAGNTFTRFNYYLSKSENKDGNKYMDMIEKGTPDGGVGVYPMYCGLMYPGQTVWQRWNNLSGDNDPKYGWWYAYANCNQYTNPSTSKMDEHGVSVGIYGGAAQGLVNNQLDEDGNITMGNGVYKRIVPFFDSAFLAEKYGDNTVTLGSSVSNIAFPFHKGNPSQTVYLTDTKGEQEKEGYYYFDSYSDVIQLNAEKKNVTYYYNEHFIYDSTGTAKMERLRGFFPYNKAESLNDSDDVPRAQLNYVFGVKMELNFNMTSNGMINGEDIIFEFNGDDDLWVFVDGYLVLDIGGAHIPVHGKIDFAEKIATVDSVKPKYAAEIDGWEEGKYRDIDIETPTAFQSSTYNFGKNSTEPNGAELYELLSDTTRNHTLTIFYMERGKANSNLKIKFNLPQITTLSVGDEVDASNVNENLQTNALWQACNNHYFKYSLANSGTKEEDYNNGVTEEVAPADRTTFVPIGLDETYRKKVTAEDSAVQRLRFYTFTGTNYYSMVVSGTQVTLPDLKGTNHNISLVDGQGVANINGTDYIFLGWTTDESYRDNWQNIQNDTYTGNVPELASADRITVKEDVDYYAVWAKKTITVSYYDETQVDTPLGYGYEADNSLPVVLIGKQTITRTKSNNTISTVNGNLWKDSDLGTDCNDDTAQRTNWKTDSTRKGFQLNGWSLEQTDEEGEHSLLPTGLQPLCSIKLYADWNRTCYRAQFQVNGEINRIIDSDGNTKSANVNTWSSNIVYFPIGYSGYLPYMNDASEVNSFLEVKNGGNGENVTCYDFTDIPIRENYAIRSWTQNDENNSSYRTVNYADENGRTLYRQEWTLGTEDAVFTGEWEKIASTIVYDASSQYDDLTKKTIKYSIGISISKPEASAIWGEGAENSEWAIVDWKNSDGEIIEFPYTITKNDEIWTAVWEKVTSTVTYNFVDKGIGITKELLGDKNSYIKYYKVNSEIELPTLQSLGQAAPTDPTGTDGNGTTYYVKANGKAYAITGWQYSDGGKVKSGDIIQEENITVDAIWTEVTTTLTVTVSVPKADTAEWDSDLAKENGWKQTGTTWTLVVDLVPGETVKSYFDTKNGSLSKKLYCADIAIGDNDMQHFKELHYATLSYPGQNINLEDEDAIIPYTAANHEMSLKGSLIQKKILTTYVLMYSGMGSEEGEEISDIEKLIGYQIYDVSDSEKELPQEGTKLLDEEGNEFEFIPNPADGYRFSGWSNEKNGQTALTTLIPTAEQHRSVWYTAWETLNTAEEESNIQSLDESESNTGTVSSGGSNKIVALASNLMRALGFNSLNGYVDFRNELYELNDLLADGGNATGTTGSNGEFYLTYDQVASFLNCFTVGSKMQLKEHAAIYSRNGTKQTYDETGYRNLYKTTWELRDLHGYIIGGTTDTDIKNMPMATQGPTSVYDGRLDGETKTAFKFSNENEATGSKYATNVRALFTHTILTGDITISKNLTTAAASVAKRKGETDQEYTFRVFFYNMFGDESDTEETIYTGKYVILNRYGNYERDDNNKIITHTAENGRIFVKNGETAVITGIPVLTKYRIEELDTTTKTGTYILSEAKEMVAKGLTGTSKNYIVSNETLESTQPYLVPYENGEYAQILQDNSGILANKKLNEFEEDEFSSIERSFTGQILQSGYTYNYVVTNEILVNGVSLYLDKIIDEYYYDENDRFTEDKKYDELVNHAKQTFVFNVKYTPVDDDGNTKESETTSFQERLTFDPTDDTIEKVNLPENLQTTANKQGYEKSGVVIGLEPGYYDISEDELWSWKYDLMGIYEIPYGNDETSEKIAVYEAESREASLSDKEAGNKVFRFYIPGKNENINRDNDNIISKGGNDYRILENVEDPVVTFVNLKAIDERTKTLGDTDVAVNQLLVPTPTPNPNKYSEIRFDRSNVDFTLFVGETLILPSVRAYDIDGYDQYDSCILSNEEIEWTITSEGGGHIEIYDDNATVKAVSEGTVKIGARYQDGDGVTIHETVSKITITIVRPQLFALQNVTYGTNQNSNNSQYKVYCTTTASSVNQNNGDLYGSRWATNGDSSIGANKIWIANGASYSPDVYWGLMFTNEKGDTVTEQKITSIKVFYERKNCTRKIIIYGIRGNSVENGEAIPLGSDKRYIDSYDHNHDLLTNDDIYTQILPASGYSGDINQVESFTIDLDPADYASYNGIKIVMLSMEASSSAAADNPWPAISEVEISGY